VLVDAAAELSSVSDHHELTIDAQPAVIEGRADDLHRLILNLLENAIRHTPPGTHIVARTGVSEGVPTLVVQDDGPGIPPELQRRVFDRFVRGGRDGGRGTGLGLAIVRAVAESHGAEVSLGPLHDDLHDAPGTRFVIRFAARPASDERPLDAVAGGEGQTSTTTGSTIGRRRSRS
jgi:two-component system, OmpR family, sensor kinase